MEIALSGKLEVGVEIEKAQYYAAQIKRVDSFLGYLAWAEVLIRTGDTKQGENILLELNQMHEKRPESYLKLWNLYYY